MDNDAKTTNPRKESSKMADGSPLVIGKANTATAPGAETVLSRNKTAPNTVFVARNLNAGNGIRGEARTSGTGVKGTSDSGTGVHGSSNSYAGVAGDSDLAGVWGDSNPGTGVYGSSNGSVGVYGVVSGVGDGVVGDCESGRGVLGITGSGVGVDGMSDTGDGVRGNSSSTDLLHAGVAGYSYNGHAVQGIDHGDYFGVGVQGITNIGVGVAGGTYGQGDAGMFVGRVKIFGDLEVVWGKIEVKSGQKNFKIDHPLDPEGRYLVHTCVESSEMKNVYDGVVRLEDGSAWVELPAWFEALNENFRYQLTAVGAPAPRLHVAEEISDGRFKIAGGEDGMKVCWQVTGTRRDRWAAANPVEVEQEKPEAERGRYLEPGLYDQTEEQRIPIGPLAERLQAAATARRGVVEEMEVVRRRMEEKRQNIEELRRQKDQRQKAPPEPI
jgi:hypothetical protein